MQRPFPAYSGDEPYVFVCYAHDEAASVYPEITWLRDNGVNIWYDEGTPPGEEFPEHLANAILGASVILFYVSPSSVHSRHCRNEVYLAMDRGIPVLAVHLAETDMPPGLALTTGTSQAIMRYEYRKSEYRRKLLSGISNLSTERRSIDVDISSAIGRKRLPGSPLVALAVIVPLLVVAGFATIKYLEYSAEVQVAKAETLPRIREMIDNRWSDFSEPYALAEQVETIIPDDPALDEIFDVISLNIDIDSDPTGADVYMRHYEKPNSSWRHIGTTPLRDVRVPIGIFRWKFEKEGYETVFAAESTWRLAAMLMEPNTISRTLDRPDDLPDGMVRVEGGPSDFGIVPDFFVDKYEVTNAEYQQFVNGNGYQDRRYWQHEFVRDGEIISWETAMAEFVDQTGRPGPSTWLGGSYPEGKANHPVHGVSWYEAAAYAEFKGRDLPTGTHWGLARGENAQFILWPQLGGVGLIAPFSNFGTEGTVPVGSLGGITAFGVHDMAGNVREWCWNDTSRGKLVRGGAWADNTYQFTELGQAPPMLRIAGYGFRTVIYPNGTRVPKAAFLDVPIKPSQHIGPDQIVDDEAFEIFKSQFEYDDLPLNAERSIVKQTAEWTHERIAIDSPYSEERMPIHVFLPRNAEPPYQTVIYLPGAGSFAQTTSDNIDTYMEFPTFLSFIVKSGRAVVYPVYQGTFERSDPMFMAAFQGDQPNSYAEWTIQVIKDLRRSVDYLETRQDIDRGKLAYYGMSWGGLLAPLALSVEERLDTGIIIAGGLDTRGRQSTNPIHYVPRVTKPVLMLAGRYDSVIGYEASVAPLYELLGTPEEDKSMIVYDSDHIPPKIEYVSETLLWLDRHFGSVSPRPGNKQ